jgi:hypothetical protein
MIRIPAIAILRPRALPRNEIPAPTDVVNSGAEEALLRQQNLAAAERQRDDVLARAALDGRIFI